MGITRNYFRFVAYFLYSLFVCYVLYRGILYDRVLMEMVSITYKPIPRQIFIIFFTIFLGLLFAVPQIIEKLKKQGSWRIDWIKLIAVGIPALYLNIQIVGYFSSLGKLFALGVLVFGSNPATQYISGIILGYMLLASLDKK